MRRCIIIRVIQAALTLWVLSLVVFYLVRVEGYYRIAEPGEVWGAAEQYELALKRLGFKEPLLARYWEFLIQSVTGDFGKSNYSKVWKVNERDALLGGLPATLRLIALALTIAAALGIPLGVFTAMQWVAPLGRMIRPPLLMLVSTPAFWPCVVLALLLPEPFSWALRFVPERTVSIFWPALALAVLTLPWVVPFVRSITLAARRLGGLSQAFREVSAPGLTFGVTLSWLIIALLVMEEFFSRQGIADPATISTLLKPWNVPELEAVMMTGGLFVILCALVLDILADWVNPRNRPDSRGKPPAIGLNVVGAPVAWIWIRRPSGKRRLPWLTILIVCAFIACAVFAPALPLHDPESQFLALNHPGSHLLNDRGVPPATDSAHPLDTDLSGFDISSGLVSGARTAAIICFTAAALGVLPGTALGLLAAWRGGWFDIVIARAAAAAAIGFPAVLVVLLFSSIWMPFYLVKEYLEDLLDVGIALGDTLTGYRSVVIAGAVVLAARSARLVRDLVPHSGNPTSDAPSRPWGMSTFLPSARRSFAVVALPLLSMVSFQLGQIILLAAVLSFLSSGSLHSWTDDWGEMAAFGLLNKSYYASRSEPPGQSLWWASVFPVLAITIVVFAFNNLGLWLRDSQPHDEGEVPFSPLDGVNCSQPEQGALVK